MDRTERVTLTNMCMIMDEDKNVVIQFRNDTEWPGVVFPGGHIEKNESICDSVKREVREETGLIVEDIQFCGIKQFFPENEDRYIVFLYKAKSYRGDIVSSSEGSIKWVPYDKLDELNLASGLKICYRFLRVNARN